MDASVRNAPVPRCAIVSRLRGCSMTNAERRAEFFMESLRTAGYTVAKKPKKVVVPWATTSHVPHESADRLLDIFAQLGGLPAYQAALTPRGWDMKADGVLVEFDEDLHFNRYRSHSLTTPWDSQLPWFVAYRSYAVDKEDMCLKAGKYKGKWASPSSNRMFGGSDPEGVLGELGPSRWKQRAIYDAIKDAYALYTPGVSLARVSIHDEIGGLNVNMATRKEIPFNPAVLRAFIKSRTVVAATRP